MTDRAWAEGILQKLDAKMTYGVEKAKTLDGIPYSSENGEWTHRGIGWWTNGFWPAEMWQMYMATGKALYRDEAVRAEAMMDAALNDFMTLHHDVGFMWLINSGVRYALEGDETSLKRVLFAGNMLAGRFNPNGFIRAWNGDRTGWSIIDTMMNLPLLYTMTKLTNDPRFELMARTHAHTAIKHFIKPDGSSYHIVCFNPVTGAVEDIPAGQGCAPGSSWARGQAWAIYGFMLSYLYTGDEAFLNTSRRVSDYFIKNLPGDMLAPMDFCQPAEPRVLDNCASGIAACGMIELSKALGAEGDTYMNAARGLLKALDDNCADWTQAAPAVLTHCSGSYLDPKSHHIQMNYGDYYFIEGVRKLLGETRLLWKPLDFAAR